MYNAYMFRAPKTGRPTRTVVEWFRNRTWFAAVSYHSGKKPYALDREFSASRAKPACLWAKYARGTTGPSEQLVLRVNETYKHTSLWYFHPVWDLAADSAIPPDDLRRLIRKIEPKVRNNLIRQGTEGNSPFWFALEYDPILVLEVFVQQASIASLAGIIAMIRVAELQQNQLLHLTGHVALAHHAEAARDVSILNGLVPDFYAMMIRRMLTTKYSETKPVKILEGMRKSTQSRIAQRDEALIGQLAARRLAHRDEILMLWAMRKTALEGLGA